MAVELFAAVFTPLVTSFAFEQCEQPRRLSFCSVLGPPRPPVRRQLTTTPIGACRLGGFCEVIGTCIRRFAPSLGLHSAGHAGNAVRCGKSDFFWDLSAFRRIDLTGRLRLSPSLASL